RHSPVRTASSGADQEPPCASGGEPDLHRGTGGTEGHGEGGSGVVGGHGDSQSNIHEWTGADSPATNARKCQGMSTGRGGMGACTVRWRDENAVMAQNDFNPNATEPEALQLAAQPMPTWVDDGKGNRFRPVLCVVVGGDSGFCFGMEIAKEGESAFELAGHVLVKSLAAARLPANVHVQVRDPELATALKRRTDLSSAEVEVVDKLEALDSMLHQMQRDLFPSSDPPLLEQPGMSLERLRAFAEAGAMFYL